MAGRQDFGMQAMPIDPDYFNHVLGHLPPLQSATEMGNWFMRILHFPDDKPETAWDVHFNEGVAQIHLIRFQASAREALQVSSDQVPTERGMTELPENEPLVLEVQNGLCHACESFGDETPGVDVYFLHFLHGHESHQAFACNPRGASNAKAEPWQRLINRITGSGLLVQRSIHLE